MLTFNPFIWTGSTNQQTHQMTIKSKYFFYFHCCDVKQQTAFISHRNEGIIRSIGKIHSKIRDTPNTQCKIVSSDIRYNLFVKCFVMLSKSVNTLDHRTVSIWTFCYEISVPETQFLTVVESTCIALLTYCTYLWSHLLVCLRWDEMQKLESSSSQNVSLHLLLDARQSSESYISVR